MSYKFEKFKINNDLIVNNKWNISPSKNNLFHFVVSAIGGVLGCISILFLGFLWEVFDGFKPHYSTAPQGKDLKSTFYRNFLYSDHFSLQDLFVWDFGGFVFGALIASLF